MRVRFPPTAFFFLFTSYLLQMNIYEVFIDALEKNQEIDFELILRCLGVYFLFFWFSIVFWVYSDAKKRYENQKTAFLIAFAVFVLFFPALIMYIAIRKPLPEDHLDFGDYDMDQGVNVPVVNFKGEDGFSIALELNIRRPSVSSPEKDMKVTVDWVSADDNFEVKSEHKNEPLDKKNKDQSMISKEEVIRAGKTVNFKEIATKLTSRLSIFVDQIKFKLQSKKKLEKSSKIESSSTSETSADSDDSKQSGEQEDESDNLG
jgi:hypothetical protein